jgi:hypothetical protein
MLKHWGPVWQSGGEACQAIRLKLYEKLHASAQLFVKNQRHDFNGRTSASLIQKIGMLAKIFGFAHTHAVNATKRAMR